MNQIFDVVAGKFANDTDVAMSDGNYLRGNLFVNLVKKNLPPLSHLLDYGCGPGRLSLLLSDSGFKVHGVDTSRGMIAEANKQNITATNVKFEAIHEFDEINSQIKYEGIVCSSVIEYVTDADALLQGFSRSLCAGGILIISFANQSSLWRQHWSRVDAQNPMKTDQHQCWTLSEFKLLLRRNGFEPISRPQFFESPTDAWPGSSFLRYSPRIGSIGLIAARISSH